MQTCTFSGIPPLTPSDKLAGASGFTPPPKGQIYATDHAMSSLDEDTTSFVRCNSSAGSLSEAVGLPLSFDALNVCWMHATD